MVAANLVSYLEVGTCVTQYKTNPKQRNRNQVRIITSFAMKPNYETK